jgi:hypothetical protein
MNVTTKVGVHFGVIGLHLLHSPHLREHVSLPNTFSWPHVPLHFTLSHKPDVKGATNNTLACHKSIIVKTRKKFTRERDNKYKLELEIFSMQREKNRKKIRFRKKKRSQKEKKNQVTKE